MFGEPGRALRFLFDRHCCFLADSIKVEIGGGGGDRPADFCLGALASVFISSGQIKPALSRCFGQSGVLHSFDAGRIVDSQATILSSCT